MPFKFVVFFSLFQAASPPFVPPWKPPCFQQHSSMSQSRSPSSRHLSPKVYQKFQLYKNTVTFLRAQANTSSFPLFPPNLCCLKEAPSESFQHEGKQDLKNNSLLSSQCREAARSGSKCWADSGTVACPLIITHIHVFAPARGTSALLRAQPVLH